MTEEVRQQYATNTNLTRRANLHQAYGRAPWFSWLADHMGFAEGDTILDVGCGPGWLWRRTTDQIPLGLHLTLLDQSEAMVAEAVTEVTPLVAQVEGRCADAATLPFADAAFDAVIMMHMLYHVPDPGQAIAEAHRVLRPGGRIFVTTNTKENLMELTQLSADVFGGTGFDLAAEIFSLDDAERILGQHFKDVTRHEIRETYACTDPLVVRDFLVSMPPANRGSAGDLATLDTRVTEAFAAGQGQIDAQKITGLVTARKP